MEIVGAIVHQLTRNMNEDDVKAAGLETYFVDHTAGVYPQFASGTPWTAATIAVKGDVLCDLNEDMAAEQKARVTYDNILRLSDDPDVNNVIRFLREREIVHYQRFGEGLRLATDRQNQKNIYAINPSFDRGVSPKSGLMPESMQNKSNMGLMPESMQNKSNTGLMPESMQNKSNTGLMPESMQNKPNMGLMPESMQNKSNMGLMPESMQNKFNMGLMPESMQNKSNTGLMPESMQNKSNTGLMPESMQNKSNMGLMPESMTTPIYYK